MVPKIDLRGGEKLLARLTCGHLLAPVVESGITVGIEFLTANPR